MVKNSKGVFQARVAKSQYRQLRRPAKKAGMRLRVKKRGGSRSYAPLPPPAGNPGGIALFFITVWFLSLHVGWQCPATMRSARSG